MCITLRYRIIKKKKNKQLKNQSITLFHIVNVLKKTNYTLQYIILIVGILSTIKITRALLTSCTL